MQSTALAKVVSAACFIVPLGLMLLLLILAASCATPVPVRFGAHAAAAPVVAVSNPWLSDGDPIAGRHAFIDMQCVDCHRVAEDPSLPRGRRAIAGPVLADMHRMAAREVANRITSQRTGLDEELYGRTMKDYAQPITARRLVDIVAYLRHPRVSRG